MAFLAPQDDDQDKQQQDGDQQGQATTGQMLSTSGPSQAPIQAGSTAAPAGGANKPSSSGQFTNLKKYITANQGNDANMGTQIRGQVDTGANNAETAGNTLKSDVGADVAKGTVKDTSGLTAAVAGLGGLSAPSAPKTAAPAAGSTARSPAATPGAPAKPAQPGAPIDPNEFTKLYNAQYGGKGALEDFSNYGNTKQGYDLVQSRGKMAGSGDFEDRGTLLKDTFSAGGKQYNRGENMLDNYILGTGEGGTKALQGIADTYGNFGDNFKNLSAMLGNKIQAGKDATAKTGETFRNTVGSAVGALDTRLGDAAKKANSANEAAKESFAALQAGNESAWHSAGLSPEALALLKSHSRGGDLSGYAGFHVN